MSANGINAVEKVLLTESSVEYYYQKLQSAGPLTDCCAKTYR